MKKSIKAALLSALIFPGVGQLATGKKTKGWGFIVSTLIIVYLMISEIIKKAKQVINDMQESGVAINTESVSQATSQMNGFSDNTYLNMLLVTFIIIWLLSIIDAGRVKDT